MKKRYEEDKDIVTDESVKEIDLKKIEIDQLNRVYNRLSKLYFKLIQLKLNLIKKYLVKLEKQDSSDDESPLKKYYKLIEKNSEKKRMDTDEHKFIRKKEENLDKNFRSQLATGDLTADESEFCVSIKAFRKILRIIDKVPPKEELELMLWEVDDDLNREISRYEVEKMYKRCLWDEEELEPKRLYRLILFLMYDKEEKNYITEEDTLELLIIRFGDKFNTALLDLFG